MKQLLIGIASIALLLFGANFFYKIYSRSFVNTHEAIILINNELADNEVDAFFKLEAGTYDPNIHRVLFSLETKPGDALLYYRNIPTHSIANQSGSEFPCDYDYNQIRPYRFYNYEIASRNVLARVISKKHLSKAKVKTCPNIAEKRMPLNFQFGKVYILKFDENGFGNYCK